MRKAVEKGFAVLQYLVLIAVSFVAAVPVYSCVITSFKTTEEMSTKPFLSMPENWMNLENYQIMIESGYLRSLLITTFIVLITVCISALLNAMVAYGLSRMEFRWKKLVYGLIVMASFIPAVTMQIYVFRVMVQLKLVNTLTGYVLILSCVDMVSIIIFSQYFSSIPKSIDEAAYLEGCSAFDIFFRIHLPLLRQAFLTVAIIRGIYVYNEYYIANIYLLDRSKYQTVTTLLNMFNTPYGHGNKYNVISAGVMLVALPTIAAFILCQKRIYNGLTSSKNTDII